MKKNRSFKGNLIKNITISTTILMLSTSAIPVAALAVGEAQVQESQVQEPQASQAMAPAVSVQANGITIAQVDTADKLKYALTQTTIGEIELTNNIVFTESIAVKNPNVKIFSPAGKRYTIDFATFHITSATAGNKLTLENLTLKNGANGAYATITYDSGSHVTARDVDFTGAEFIMGAGGVTLGGTVEVNINDASGSDHNSISVYGSGTKGEFVVEDNANVTIRQNAGSAYYGSILLDNATKFVVGTNATLNLIQDGKFTDGKPLIYNVSSIPLSIKSGGAINVENNISGIAGIYGAFTSLSVEKDASFNVKTKNALPLQLTTASATFDIAGEIDFNNRITGTPTSKNAISMGDNSTMKFSGNDVSVWDIANQTENASKSWASIAGLTTFSGLNTKSSDTNNFDFNYDFKAQKYSRISNKVAMEKTTINELNTNSTVVTGSAKPNATIEIKAGNTVLGSGQVGSDGNYSITIAKQIAGTVVTATATWNGQTSIATTTVQQGWVIANTTVDEVSTNSTAVTGKAEPNATIEIKAGNTVIGSGQVGSDGNYSITIAKQVAGTVLTATATFNSQASTATTTVQQGWVITKTTVGELTTDSTVVTGKAEPNATIEIKAGNTVIGTGKVGSDGNYSVTIAKQVAGTVVTATASLNNQTSTGSVTVIEAKRDSAGTITQLNTFNILSDTVVRGTWTGDVAKTAIKIDDVVLPQNTSSNGVFSYYVGAGKIKANSVVYAIAYDKDGNKLDEKLVTVTNPVTAGTITSLATFNPMSDRTITGTWTGDVAKTAIKIDDIVYPQNLSSNGIFSYYVGVGKITFNSKVYAIAYDKDGNKLDEKLVTISNAVVTSKINTLVTFDPILSSTVSGTWVGNVAKSALEINGTVLSKNGSSNGTFNYYVGKGKITKDSIVYAIVYDANDVELDRKLLPIVGSNAITTLNDFSISNSSSVTGTWAGNVAKTSVIINGVEKVQNGSTNGVFSYWVGKNTLKKTDTVYGVAYDENNNEVGRRQLVIVD